MKLDGYIRVSQVKGRDLRGQGDAQGESFLSPDLQRKQIEGWARLHKHEIVKWHVDLDQSGGKMDRPHFVEMMTRIKEGKTEGVAVAKLDRFARSLLGALDAIKFLSEHSATFVSVAEGVDPSTPAGKMMLRLLLVLGEFELDRVRESWHSAVTDAIVERGIQPTVAPFGYRKDAHKRFVPDPQEASFVKEIFRRRLAGHTWTAIARWLNTEGVRPRRSEQWIGETVKQLTRREAYIGVAAKGAIRNEHAHEPLVSKTDFTVCREVFAKDNRGGGRGQTSHVLNGLIRCAGCSRLMSGRGYKQKGQPRVAQYQCQVHHSAGDCEAPANVNESIVLPYIEQAFFDYIGDVSVESRAESTELAQALEDQRLAETTLSSYRDDLSLQATLGMESFKAGLRVRQQALVQAMQVVAQARQAAVGIELPPVEHLTSVWNELSPSERQRLLASAIDVIYVRRSGSGRRDIETRVKILWRGENVHALSGPGRSVPLRSESW